jgi:hypothetical protein
MKFYGVTETKAWRDPKVKPKAFNVRDLVLLQSSHTESLGKLESKWNGPYMVRRKVKTRVVPFIKFARKNAGAFLECG